LTKLSKPSRIQFKSITVTNVESGTNILLFWTKVANLEIFITCHWNMYSKTKFQSKLWASNQKITIRALPVFTKIYTRYKLFKHTSHKISNNQNIQITNY
jgi:hypothetical protein